MPWVPKKDTIRRLRELRNDTTWELARRAGISERQIRKLESETPPKSIRMFTLRSLARSLDCTPEEIATWEARRVLPKTARPQRRPQPKKRAINALTKAGLRMFTLAESASIERERRLRGETLGDVKTPVGTFEMLGPERFAECCAQCGAYEGQLYLVVGKIVRSTPLDAELAKKLGTQADVGARFQLWRAFAPGSWFFVTVFTRTAKHTRELIEAGRDPIGFVAAIVRVHVARPKYKWRGFPLFEQQITPSPFALVVDTVFSLPPDLCRKLAAEIDE
ncbi:MAG TPA: helix-turn-helix transcriptional regulator [Casimicrobiaceae bacterium]|nr:helix-turn-helix transcriptional regulator [Casimicrobiaceae bacterium]